MNNEVIKDWTERLITLKQGAKKTIKYQVYCTGNKLFQEIRAGDDAPITTLELPANCLDKNSYEVLLRYALRDLLKTGIFSR